MQEATIKENNQTMLALAALMFFAPFVGYMLRKQSIPLTQSQSSFVEGYTRLGYLSIVFLVLSIVGGVGGYLWALPFLNVVYTMSVGILLLILLLGTLCILADIPLGLGKHGDHPYYTMNAVHKDTLLMYLPGYNIYLRYTAHDFARPNRWLKESLLWWVLIWLMSFAGNGYLTSVLLLLLIFRVATLTIGVDFLHLQSKEDISNLFSKNPEEIRGYLTGTLLYLGQWVKKLFRPTSPSPSYHLCIEQEKTIYSLLYPLGQGTGILWEYLIGGALLAGYLWLMQGALWLLTTYIPLALWSSRYLIMLFQWRHLPHLPLAREIKLLILLPYRLLSSLRSAHA